MSILHDNYHKTLEPILSLKPFFLLRDGIFSPLERLSFKVCDVDYNVQGKRSLSFYKYYLNKNTNIIIDSVEETNITPEKLIYDIDSKIIQDIYFLSRDIFLNNKFDGALEGNINNLFIAPNVTIGKYVSINTEKGPVVIDTGANISNFSLIVGPVYIGKYSQLNRASVTSSIIGNYCRIGGEVSNSIFGNYTNKSHEGFIGHSIIGDWVNLGALTTTSNLKNNYGNINLKFKDVTYATNVQKFGSIIGDYCKTGIGTMLNTGSILDIGTLLYEGRPSLKYYSPFFWGGKDVLKYDFSRFCKDIELIMKRRDQIPPDFIINLLKEVYDK